MKLYGALFAATLALVTPVALAGQNALAPAAPAPAASKAPAKLIVVISVDQFSADLFAEYRRHFTGGFARLQQGAVFPSGYQSHAATETCPGHSTILTGFRPAHTGIIANNWVDLNTARQDKTVYCAEDESVPGSNSVTYTVSDKHLLVPTLGERMKAANPASRVVSVSGKDRAAVMMGGHHVDELWWWDGKHFTTYAGRTEPAVVTRANQAVAAEVATAQGPLDLPDFCAAHDVAVDLGSGKSVGTGRFARAAGDAKAFRASPEIDGAAFALAAGLIQDMKLGKGEATDIIDIGASATDYVGHTYGTEGAEMCLQLAELDKSMGDFFTVLDRLGLDYEVVLTADHGGHDIPERHRQRGLSDAARIDPGFTTKSVSDAVAAKLHLTGQLLYGDSGSGDIWIDPKLPPKTREAVLKEALAIYRANPQVAFAFSRAEIDAAPWPTLPPPLWLPVQRAKASYYAPRSGDIVVALKPNITPIADPTKGYVATHGSFWDYDRRVPILFWRKGMAGFEEPLAIETVDIMPTLAASIGLPVAAPLLDGKCRDIGLSTGTCGGR